MHQAIAQFLRYLAIERNASDLTIKSYREDLIDLADFLVDLLGANVQPKDISPRDLRGYVAALHEAGYAQSSMARKLASLRSFYRFAQRQQLCDSNPAKPLRNPRGRRKAAALSIDQRDWQPAGCPGGQHPLGLRDRAILETMYSAGLTGE